jgi:hypothetical protein
MRQRLLTKRGRLILPVIGIGLAVLIWARLNDFDSGPKALIIIFLMSVLGGVVQFIAGRVGDQEEHSEPPEPQETMLTLPPSPPAQVGYEGRRLLTVRPSDPEREH